MGGGFRADGGKSDFSWMDALRGELVVERHMLEWDQMFGV